MNTKSGQFQKVTQRRRISIALLLTASLTHSREFVAE